MADVAEPAEEAGLIVLVAGVPLAEPFVGEVSAAGVAAGAVEGQEVEVVLNADIELGHAGLIGGGFQVLRGPEHGQGKGRRARPGVL